MSKQKIWISDVVTTTLLLVYGVFFAYLYFSQKILFFVHPDYAFLGLIAAGIFFVLVITNMVSFFKPNYAELSEKCDVDGCSDTAFFSKISNIIIVAIPLILSLIFPVKPLSSATALIRSSGYNNDAGLSRSSSVRFSINPENRQLIDWIRLFSMDPEPDHYKGQKAKVLGFVMTDNTLPPDYFLVSRFVISCCVADARPVGIPVHYDPSKFHFTENEWVQVEGTFDTATVQDERQPIIELQSYQQVPVPDNPYVE